MAAQEQVSVPVLCYHRFGPTVADGMTVTVAAELGASARCAGVVVEKNDDAGLGAELARAQRARPEELVGDPLRPLQERSGEEEDGIDARRLDVDRPAGGVGGRLEGHPAWPAPREGRGSERGMGDEGETVVGPEMEDELNGRLRQE